MKDHIKQALAGCREFHEVKTVVDQYIDYYNNHRYQWELAKLAPNEFYDFYTTRVYPLDIPKKPMPPVTDKKPDELGAGITDKY